MSALPDPILTDLSAAALVAAIEANFVAWWRYFGHAPDARLHDDTKVLWLESGMPITVYNGVIRATFDEHDADDDIVGVVRRLQVNFSAKGQGMAWYVGPSTTPAHLTQLLEGQGFVCWGPGPGMAVELLRLPSADIEPEGLEVVRVASEAHLAAWASVAALGYGEDRGAQSARLRIQAQLQWAEDAPLQRYLGLIDGKPVATSALFLAAGVAGLYEVLTLPSVRRRGIGRAMTCYPLLTARQRGYQVGVLEASPMGLPLYRRLGFREFCRFLLYAWEPAPTQENEE